NNLLLNEELASRYRLDDVLDRSGLGAVFKAYDKKLGIDVAIKVIDLKRVDEPALEERVQQEVRTAIKLDHPNIVKVYDYGHVGSMLYIIMEYIPGYDLEQARQSFKHVPLHQLLRLCRHLCLTVDYLHQNGVLHPGTKPKNIMLKPDKTNEGQMWHPVLINLGFLRPNQEIIKTGHISVRRLIYLVSPELLLGHRTDLRSDVYSMGILLYDILVGQPPFWPSNLEEAIHLHVEVPPPAPRSLKSDLPESVEKVLLRALAKDPAERYLSLKGLAQDLAECLDALTLPDKQAQPPRPALPLTDLNVTFDTRLQTVTPGEAVTYRMLLHNNGTQDDYRQIRVDGVPAEWVTVSPATTNLAPQERDEIEIEIRPPLSPQSRAGRRSLTFQVVNQHDPGQIEEFKTNLTIAPFYQFESNLWPQELTGEQVTQITVENQGNTAASYTIQPKEDKLLKFQPSRQQLKLDVGEKGAADFKVAFHRRYLVGDVQTHTFSLVLTSANQQTVTHSGQITDGGRFPVRWALVSLLALMLCACAALVLYLQAPALIAEQTGIAVSTSNAAVETRAAQATQQQSATATAIIATANWLAQDTDRDGLTNAEEQAANTDPTSYDTDGDTLPDGAELKELNTDPLRPDTDFDGIRDDVEVLNIWDPKNKDTDLDGTPDAFDDNPNRPPTVTPEGGTPASTLTTLVVGFNESQSFLTRIFLSSPPRYLIDENGGRAIIEVTLNRPADRVVRVNYYIINSNAIAGQDYTFNPGTLEFIQGEQEKSIELFVIDDTEREASRELIILGLREPSAGVALGVDRLELQIEDND
ncbi:MAG: protein kinase, partial [Anaerolineae bacterium]|nr:protein kinase [Anaerolineae bacterium]